MPPTLAILDAVVAWLSFIWTIMQEIRERRRARRGTQAQYTSVANATQEERSLGRSHIRRDRHRQASKDEALPPPLPEEEGLPDREGESTEECTAPVVNEVQAPQRSRRRRSESRTGVY